MNRFSKNQTAQRKVCITASLIALLAATSHVAAVEHETVFIGNPGNSNDPASVNANVHPNGVGGVDYEYRIAKTEVTNAQYAEFLNAVAATDTHRLYSMGEGHPAGPGNSTGMLTNHITRTGANGSYSYQPIPGRENLPIAHVDVWDTFRYANWLHNGQPSGGQDATTTEDGAYSLNGVTAPVNTTVTRNADARWFLPTQSEWHKAAYHKNDGVTGNYFVYPTSSDAAPTPSVPTDNPNTANYESVILREIINGIEVFGDYTPVGSYPNSLSPYGTLDQGGNISEWTETIADAPPVNPFSGRTSVGGHYIGSFTDPDSAADMRSNVGFVSRPSNEIHLIGFRVATVPEPTSSSMVLFAISSGIFMSRKQRFGSTTNGKRRSQV